MGWIKGMKHSEESKLKMSKPRDKELSATERLRRSEKQKLYHEARRAFVQQYVTKYNNGDGEGI